MRSETMGTKFIIKGDVPYQYSAFFKSTEMAVLSGQDPQVMWNLGKHEESVVPLPAGGPDPGSIFQDKMEIRVRYQVINRRHALFPAI